VHHVDDVALDVPPWLHLLLWPLLLGWTAKLIRHQRDWRWLHSPPLGAALVLAALGANGAAVLTSNARPEAASAAFLFAIVWLAWLLSITAFMALRSNGRGDSDPGLPEDEDPEPPWWPDFERQLRDYTRSRPRAPAEGPRTPARAL
jgi:hypothetical protein